MEYLLTAIWLMVCVFLFDVRGGRGVERWRGPAWWVTFAILVALAGLRYRIGADTIAYAHLYQNFPTLGTLTDFDYTTVSDPSIERIEPGFPVICSLTRTLSPDFVWFQILEALVVNLAFFRFIRSNTTHPFLGVLIYCCSLYVALNFELMRQALAVALLLYAWPSYRDGRWGRYYMWVLVAPAFHFSALVLWLLPLLQLRRVRPFFTFGRRAFWTGCALLLAGFALQYLLGILCADVAPEGWLTRKAAKYLQGGMLGQVYNWKGIIGLTLRYILAPVGAMAWLRLRLGAAPARRVRMREKNTALPLHKLENLALLSIFTTILAIPLWGMLRFNNYFVIFAMVLVSTVTFEPWPPLRLRKFYTCKLSSVCYAGVVLVMLFMQLYSFNARLTADGRYRLHHFYYPYNHCLDPRRNVETDSAFMARGNYN